MYKKTKLAAIALLLGSTSIAQATTYDVSATFTDGGIQGVTLFNGSFDLTGSTISNFTGLLSESMWGWDSAGANGAGFYMSGTAGGMHAMGMAASKVYAKPGGYANDEAPLLSLTHQLATSSSAGVATATIFLDNNTNVFMGGGYAPEGAMTNGTKNGFFTLNVDINNPLNTTATMADMAYGDCTSLGLMSGVMCMTGHKQNANGLLGTMNGAPVSLAITAAVSAVPLPAAAWLFGGALTALFGANRRKNVLPA